MMDRFLKWFYNWTTSDLVNEINEYAEQNNLKIISLTVNDDLHGAIVLFEGKTPRY